jgi:hypothetical protein
MSVPYKRNMFLTIWLWLIIILNLFVGVLYLVEARPIHEYTPNVPVMIVQCQAALMMVNVLCAVGIMQGKRLGFWGLCIMAVVGCYVTIQYQLASVSSAILGNCFSTFALFCMLNVGGKNKAWTRLH